MVTIFFELVKRVGIFVVIGQTILHLGISKVYEKYMKLVISFMVAAQIVFAFGTYLYKAESDRGFEEAYYENWEENMKKLEEEFKDNQLETKMKIEERFLEQEMSVERQGGENQSKIRIEKIVIQ